ncbi:MAG: hypothetical protein MPW15_21815 [Candidatus Manganitrophus sp.]|nr:hypothetical protein [Candidatus Manganitrophus sp.]
MSIEPKEIEPTGWVNKLGPYFVILFLGLALAGFIISFLLPSIWKPDSLAAVELIKADYQSMLMEGINDLPKETTAYAEREECWTGDQTHCVYGWYTEWKGAIYLISYTYGTREDDRRGILRGWWWEVDMKKQNSPPRLALRSALEIVCPPADRLRNSLVLSIRRKSRFTRPSLR